jgi:hypothetical protein
MMHKYQDLGIKVKAYFKSHDLEVSTAYEIYGVNIMTSDLSQDGYQLVFWLDSKVYPDEYTIEVQSEGFDQLFITKQPTLEEAIAVTDEFINKHKGELNK